MYRGVIRFSEILKMSKSIEIKSGCLVDTSILFAGSFDLDEFNTPSVQLFDFLAEIGVPLFTNVNIRSEFIDLHRRVTIPEGLCSLLSVEGKDLPSVIYTKLQSVYSRLNAARNSGRTFKFNEDTIGEWRSYLRAYEREGVDGWESFCKSFLQGKIERIWDETCNHLGINFLSMRESDSSDWIEGDLTWEQMASLVGRFGIGSFDAMILNLFLNSKFTGLITADKEVAYVIERLSPRGKAVIIPDRLHL